MSVILRTLYLIDSLWTLRMSQSPSKSALGVPTINSAMTRRSKKRGTTLVELMACLVFLSLAVYPMLACITGSQTRALNAQDRLLVLGALEDKIETQRGIALTLALTTGTTSSTTTPTGLVSSLTITQTITLVTGYSDLYQVSETGTWGSAVLPWRNGSMTISTYMRAPHV